MFEQSHAPGVDPAQQLGASTYLIGLGFALAPTIALFLAAPPVYAPAVLMLLAALAIAQMGMHCCAPPPHFEGSGSGQQFPCLGLRRVCDPLIVFGSIMIVAHYNHNMMPMDELMKMQR